MAKKPKIEELIGPELGNFEEKLKEFQQYLKINTIITKVTDGNSILLTEENQDKLHKEIIVQMKMQEYVLNWLPLLKRLKETEVITEKTYGNKEVGGAFRKITS